LAHRRAADAGEPGGPAHRSVLYTSADIPGRRTMACRNRCARLHSARAGTVSSFIRCGAGVTADSGPICAPLGGFADCRPLCRWVRGGSLRRPHFWRCRFWKSDGRLSSTRGTARPSGTGASCALANLACSSYGLRGLPSRSKRCGRPRPAPPRSGLGLSRNGAVAALSRHMESILVFPFKLMGCRACS